ncbi:MAG: hypothetical protein HY951_15365 [Bacteroidia bacterium]|nr:hypothetical protein [Bacteroidia bacterium]
MERKKNEQLLKEIRDIFHDEFQKILPFIKGKIMLLTSKEVALAYNIDQRQLKKLVKEGFLIKYKLGNDEYYSCWEVFNRGDDLQKALNSNKKRFYYSTEINLDKAVAFITDSSL